MIGSFAQGARKSVNFCQLKRIISRGTNWKKLCNQIFNYIFKFSFSLHCYTEEEKTEKK